MKSKAYDLFISYSHADRELVHRVAFALNVHRIRVWFDGWEMKPGDILRERIGEGIAKASYFLVVLSPASLGSNWVKYELNSGMVEEIEQDRVRVIPALAPNTDYSMLPADLRAKYCLDFRSKESFDESIEAIVDLVQPELRLRRELLQRLRKPQGNGAQTVKELSLYANGGRDQTIQVAALRGLEKIPGPDATLAVTERALDPWGMSALTRALHVLSRRTEDGGLLALSAILLIDNRLFYEKLNLLLDALRKLNDTTQLAASIADEISRVTRDTSVFNVQGILGYVLGLLSRCPCDDIRYGSMLYRLDNWTPQWVDGPPLLGIEEEKHVANQFSEAVAYAERRLPGLLDLIRRRRAGQWAVP